MFARIKLLVVAAVLTIAPASFGQMMYGGYDTGPDYGAMVNQGMANMNNIVGQANARGEQAIHWAMNNPQCADMYRQHQMQGGQLSYRDFSYQFAGTGGFTPGGKAHFHNVGQWNSFWERNAAYGVRAAEGMRGAAIQEMNDNFSDNQEEFRGQL